MGMEGAKRKLVIVSVSIAVIVIVVVLGMILLQSKSDNELPVAGFGYTNDVNTLNVTFNASESYDPNGSIASYSWSFGDDTTGEGIVVMHTYLTGGTYEAVLTVKDDEGGESRASDTLFVNIRPVVVFDVISASEFKVVLSGANSYDPDGGSLDYEWAFIRTGDSPEDSVIIRSAFEVDVTHVFDAAGEYMVYLGVTDDEGNTSSIFRSFHIPL